MIVLLGDTDLEFKDYRVIKCYRLDKHGSTSPLSF